MNKLLIALFIMVTTLVSPLVLATPEPANKAELSYLFIQVGTHGSLMPVKGKAGWYQLELRNVGEYVHYFSDRPNRITGLYPTAQFVSKWNNDNNPNGFNKMSPNAALSALNVHLLKNKQVSTVLQLSNPTYNPQKNTMTYMAQILPGEEHIEPMKHLEQVALFIDSYCASCVGKGF